jgi:hypothetical protein
VWGRALDPACYGKSTRNLKNAGLSVPDHGQASSRRKMSRSPCRIGVAAMCNSGGGAFSARRFDFAMEADHLRSEDKQPGNETGGHPGEVLG